jgi:hypothetical protein
MSAIQEILARLSKARSIDEGDDISDELAKAARENPQEVIDLFYANHSDIFSLVWCLQGQTNEKVVHLFLDALKHMDANVRWAASEGLKHSRSSELIPVFIDALKDRSHMVKGVAVEWLKANGDARATEPLRRLTEIPSMIRTSPGIVKEAQDALARLSQRDVRK